MYDLITSSGARYHVENGRINRTAEHGISGYPSTITNAPFQVLTPAVVGQCFRFQLAGDATVITTSTVKHIIRPRTCTCGPAMRPGAYDPACPIDGWDEDDDDLLAAEQAEPEVDPGRWPRMGGPLVLFQR